jgi:hypothetical protein
VKPIKVVCVCAGGGASVCDAVYNHVGVVLWRFAARSLDDSTGERWNANMGGEDHSGVVKRPLRCMLWLLFDTSAFALALDALAGAGRSNLACLHKLADVPGGVSWARNDDLG